MKDFDEIHLRHVYQWILRSRTNPLHEAVEGIIPEHPADAARIFNGERDFRERFQAVTRDYKRRSFNDNRRVIDSTSGYNKTASRRSGMPRCFSRRIAQKESEETLIRSCTFVPFLARGLSAHHRRNPRCIHISRIDGS